MNDLKYRSYCSQCNSIIESKGKWRFFNKTIFCTKECSIKYKAEEQKHKTNKKRKSKHKDVEITCHICKKTFIGKAYRTKRTKRPICSKECKKEFWNIISHTIKKCSNCGKDIKKRKWLSYNRPNNNSYCNRKCRNEYNKKQCYVEAGCLFCNNKVIRRKITLNSNSKGPFCSHSCVAKYRHANSIPTGYNVSKPEKYIQAKLLEKYPMIEFMFNRKDTIKSELDIYIPEFKLAFELNGIFHYEPIFGEENLKYVENNDKRKFQACLENNIELCIVDISKLKYLKPERVAPYLKIITDIIDSKINQRGSAS